MVTQKTVNVMSRRRTVINTDPQRRCYNGCHFSSETVWTEWETLEWDIPKERAEKRLQFWRELNDYAVGQRGKSAKCEFKLIETE